jgi:hypothetical protein
MPIFDNMTPDEREVLMDKIGEVLSRVHPGQCVVHLRSQIFRLLSVNDTYTLRVVNFTPEVLNSITALIAEYAVAPVELKCKLRDRNGVFVSFSCKIKNTWLRFNRDERAEYPRRWEMTSEPASDDA